MSLHQILEIVVSIILVSPYLALKEKKNSVEQEADAHVNKGGWRGKDEETERIKYPAPKTNS